MDLDVAGGDRRDAAMAAQGADFATNDDRVAFLQAQPLRVILVHQHVVAPRAVERVAVAVDDAVELFAASVESRSLPSFTGESISITENVARPSGVAKFGVIRPPASRSRTIARRPTASGRRSASDFECRHRPARRAISLRIA